MKFISHRGNIQEKIEEQENNPEKILFCLSQGYDVEIDVWYSKNKFFLGHDSPTYEVEKEFLKDSRLWCHAKNVESLNKMLNLGINCFWHQEDDYTITSKKLIWVYPGKLLLKNSVAVMPEKTSYSLKDLKICYGVCSDKIEFYKKYLETE